MRKETPPSGSSWKVTHGLSYVTLVAESYVWKSIINFPPRKLSKEVEEEGEPQKRVGRECWGWIGAEFEEQVRGGIHRV
jgi:hypothetical protein